MFAPTNSPSISLNVKPFKCALNSPAITAGVSSSIKPTAVKSNRFTFKSKFRIGCFCEKSISPSNVA